MTFVILNSLEEAESLNQKINDYMIENVEGYDAEQWSRIYTDNNGHFAIYVKSKDERSPLNALDITTKNKIISELPEEFLNPEKTGKMTVVDSGEKIIG